jgi:acyl carrier protein
MPPDTVLTGLTEVLGDVAGVDPADVTPEVRFGHDLGIDSLTLVEVVVAAEDRFGLLINDDDWPRFKTVLDATRYLDQAAAVP